MYKQEEVRNVSRVGSIRPVQFSSQKTTQGWDASMQHNDIPPFRMFDATPCFPIEVLIKKTNVPLITLRAWERYYGLPSPWSDQQTVKLYSQRDIEVARWLREQIATKLSIRQAMDLLVRHEPDYAVDHKVRASQLLVPPRREISETRDLLMQAIVSINKASATRLLADVFATYPARMVCQQVLQPVLNQTVTLQRENEIPEAAKAFAFSLVHLQFNHLIEACFTPKGASQYLYSLLTQSPKYGENAPFNRPERTISSLGTLENMLYSALSSMNGTVAREIINTAFLYYPLKDVCVLLLQRVLQRIEETSKTYQSPDSWTNFSVRLLQQTLFQHFQSTPNLRRGLPIIVGCAPHETNEIHALMLALFWRTAGRHVYYLGQTPNAEGIFYKLQRLPRMYPSILYLSAQAAPRITDVIAVGQALHRLGQQRPLICFGGSPFARAHSQSQQTPGIYLGTRLTTVDRSMGELLRLCSTLSLGQVEELVGGSLLTNFRDETKTQTSLVTPTGDLRNAGNPPSIELIGKTPLAPESRANATTVRGAQTQGTKQRWIHPEWKGTHYYPGSNEIHKALPGLLFVVLPLVILTQIIWGIELVLQQTLLANVFIGAILALLVGNFLPLPEYIQPGLVFCTRWFLRPAIVLTGLNFSATFLLQCSLPGLLLALTSTVIAFTIAIGGGVFLKVPARTSVLIGAGAASGGVSAVMSLAPALRARDEETAVALGAILFWGTMGLFFYPLAELLLHPGPNIYGAWTGAALPDFAQLVAATQQGGGAVALQFALVIKLIRMVLGIIITYTMRQWDKRGRKAGKEHNEEEDTLHEKVRKPKSRLQTLNSLPMLIPAFVGVVLLNTLTPLPGWLTGPLATWPVTTFPTTLATLFFLCAIIGICTRVTRASVKLAGLNTIVLGMCIWIIQAVALFVLTALLFHLY